MCGICGFINFNNNYIKNDFKAKERIESMIKKLQNNNDKYNISTNEHAVFANSSFCPLPIRRIVAGYEFSVICSCNIENTDELRKELSNSGYDFIDFSDSELILYAYIHYGEKCCEKIKGTFVIAIWDAMRQRVFICHDSYNDIPMFYSVNKDTIVFSTNAEALFTFPELSAEIDKSGICALLSSMRMPGKSVFKNVNELDSSYYMICSRRGIELKSYKTCNEYNPGKSSYGNISLINSILKTAVRQTLNLEEYSQQCCEQSVYLLPYISMAKDSLRNVIMNDDAPILAFVDKDKLTALLDSHTECPVEFIDVLLNLNSFFTNNNIRIV